MKKGFARRDYQHRKEKQGFAEMAAAERGEPAREQRLDKHEKDEENIKEMYKLVSDSNTTIRHEAAKFVKLYHTYKRSTNSPKFDKFVTFDCGFLKKHQNCSI